MCALKKILMLVLITAGALTASAQSSYYQPYAGGQAPQQKDTVHVRATVEKMNIKGKTVRVAKYGNYYVVLDNVNTAPRTKPVTYSSKGLVTGLKTNLLYDAALTPNIGVELYFSRQWSILMNIQASDWHNKATNWHWKNLGLDLAFRKWFGIEASRALTGHHIGPYIQTMSYNYCLGEKGMISNRANWAVGLEYGYSLGITPVLNIDFSVGLGYMGGGYDTYLPDYGEYLFTGSAPMSYFGPTKLEVSLVWRLGDLY